MTIKTRAELISALARLYAARRSAFDESDLRGLLALLDGLCRAPFNDGEAAAAAAQANAGLGAAGLPPVQRAVLEFLPQWGPLDDRHVRAGLWSATFQMLLAYLPGEPPGASARLGARAETRLGLRDGTWVRGEQGGGSLSCVANDWAVESRLSSNQPFTFAYSGLRNASDCVSNAPQDPTDGSVFPHCFQGPRRRVRRAGGWLIAR